MPGSAIWYPNGPLNTAATTRYAELWCGATGTADGSGSYTTMESQRQCKINNAGTFSLLYYNCITWTLAGPVTMRFRVGGSNGNESISISATGEFQDTSDSDGVAATNLVNWSLGSVASGQAVSIIVGQLFTPTLPGAITSWIDDGDNASDSSAITYRVVAGNGPGGAATAETNNQWKVQRAGTLKNLNVFQNTYTAVTGNIKTRIGVANGNQVVTPNAINTQFADTSDSDSIAVGNLINYVANVTSGTNTAFGTSFIAVDFLDNALGTMYVSGNALSGITFVLNTTYYLALATRLRSSQTEAQASQKTGTAFTASNLQCYPIANTITASTVMNFRIAAGNGNQTITVGSSAHGSWITDTSDSDYVTPNVAIDMKMVVPNNGTALTLGEWGFSANYFVGAPAAR